MSRSSDNLQARGYHVTSHVTWHVKELVRQIDWYLLLHSFFPCLEKKRDFSLSLSSTPNKHHSITSKRLRLLSSPMAGLCRLRSAVPLLLHLRRLTLSRSFVAAAVAHPQFDDNYHSESEYEPRRGPGAAPMEGSEGSAPIRGVQWVFIGNPGAKKHVYAEKLSKILQVPHISISSLVRQDLHPGSSLYDQIANAVNNGKHVPESVILGLLSERLEAGYYRAECGFILNGIPRSVPQAEILDQLAVIDLVVNFKCADGFCVKDQESGKSSHCNECCSTSNSDSATVDMSASPVQAKSATPSKGMVGVYLEQIKLLEDYYSKQKKILNFQVRNAPGETWKGLLAALHLQHVDAKHTS